MKINPYSGNPLVLDVGEVLFYLAVVSWLAWMVVGLIQMIWKRRRGGRGR